jgi:hypothetical protein
MKLQPSIQIDVTSAWRRTVKMTEFQRDQFEVNPDHAWH